MDARGRARSARLPAALFAVALLAACSGSAPSGGVAERPRNVLLISIDTLRPDHLGCYGHARETSPTLDGIAARGVRFTDVTAASPWTLPSHATLLTGLYPSHHGVKNHETRLAEDCATLAEDFRAGGFRTLAVVNTWNVGAPQFGLAQGFDGFHYVPETKTAPDGRQKTLNAGAAVVARARELLEAGDAARPFFLFLHFYDVHTDFTPRPEYRERFVEPYDGRLKGRTQELVLARNAGRQLATDDLRWLRQMYDAEIRQLDDLLGEFFAWLDGRGELASTLVAVTSDHGEEFQEHGGLLHGRTQYQEVLRVPLLLQGPGVPAGAVIATPVHGVDVAPTLLACAGVVPGAARDGLDLSPLWRGGALPERPLFGEADHTNFVAGEHLLDIKHMVRRGDEKLHFDRHARIAALYDLARDPGELRDLSGERPERVRALQEELERFRAGAVAGDAVPEPNAEELRLLEELGYGGDTDE